MTGKVEKTKKDLQNLFIGIIISGLGIFFFSVSIGVISLVNVLKLLILVIPLLFAFFGPIYQYRLYNRRLDKHAFPLSAAIFLVIVSVELLLLFIFSKDAFRLVLENLSGLEFIIAIFALALAAFYSIDAKLENDSNYKQIQNELAEIKNCFKKNVPEPERELRDYEKDETPLSEDDKIIMEHLFERHRISLTSGDAIDIKLAQMIALNGLILSFILIKSPDVKNFYIFIAGIGILVCAVVIGILGYRSTEWCAGANDVFFKEWGINFSSRTGVNKLKEMLSADIRENKETLNKKTKFFDYMLYFNIIGLVTVIVGYYV